MAMKILLLLLFCSFCADNTLSVSSSSRRIIIPRATPLLSTILRETAENNQAVISGGNGLNDDFETYFYDQTLDHFNYNPEISYNKFKQRYVVNSKFWGGAQSNSPIFCYLGAEAPIDGDVSFIGFLTDNAPRFKALAVYIEHRYYGKSVPAASFEEALDDDRTRGYFNSAQALADYAEVLLHVKERFSAYNSPIIVVGGSYGGMLASWFRLKYPHIAVGAVASSAPILYFDNITPQNGYYSIVTRDFKEVSESCEQTIRQSWSVMDEVASKPNGLSILSQRFKTCSRLNNSSELKDYLDSVYSTAAQYNSPPRYPVTVVCGGIDGAPKGTDILGRIFAGLAAYRGNKTCYDTSEYNRPSETQLGWSWQTCSEMVMPVGRGSNDTMFQAAPFDVKKFSKGCSDNYGVSPRPHWITTYYGGHDIKLILRRFASNIIFSNGLRDPYSSGGVLENLSRSLVAVSTVNGSHCLDILLARKDDPSWLVAQRKVEVRIIEGWLKNYYFDLSVLKKKT